MEQNSSNNMPPPPMLCRSGCGFYGSPSFEGMCSKCFKDNLKRRQQNTSPTALLNQSAISAAVSETAISVKTSSTSSPTPPRSVSSVKDSPTPGATATSPTMPTSTTPSVETASPTVPTASPSSSQDKEDGEKGAQPEVEGATVKDPVTEESPSSEVKKPKKSKCHTCKKKVGLTGFQCRCGGLYCSMHRYSDKHDCQFDYRELAQQQIRKQNPVVVGQKVQKI